MESVITTIFENQASDIGMNSDGASAPGLETKARARRGAALPVTHDLICTHDLDGRILSVNSAACAALAASATTLCGLRIQQLLTPTAAVGFVAYLERLLRNGFDVGMMKVVTPEGGRRIWEYRNTLDVDETCSPIVLGVARDVTQREEAFDAVRRSEEHFRSIIESASDVIAIVELDGRLRYVSPSAEHVLGYPRNVLLGTPVTALIHPDDAARATDLLARQTAEPAAIHTFELRMRHHGGTWRSFEIVMKNLIKEGRASALVMNARDIAERKHLQGQLVQAHRLGGLGRLAATVAHEFNNVLMGMQPFAELMQRPDATSPMMSKGAAHIASSIQRGKRIVLDILRFTQPYLPIATPIDLGEWWDSFAPEAEAVVGNLISVRSTIPRRGLYAVADRTQLTQVLVNLVANARHAMSTGGILTVGAHDLKAGTTFPFGAVPNPDLFVQISVRDTGKGMSAEVMDRVFEPLFTTRQSGGTGLGLAVAHQILTQHGGYIFVESEPGVGSTFHLFLPKAAPPESNEAPGDEHGRKPAARRLLMIEDEDAIVEGVTALLEDEGIEVQAVTTGAQAVEAVTRFRPDVVLLDFGLPDMDGSEVYARIRELRPTLPIIFASGHGAGRMLQHGIEDPQRRVLAKPFEVTDLLAMIVDLEQRSTS